MKKIAFAALMMAGVFMSGCNFDYDDNGYSDVYPGVVIYDDAVATNLVATDGVSVAMRLAMLFEELESAEFSYSDEFDWDELGSFTYGYDGNSYKKKEFLFGTNDDTTIENLGSGVYSITYGDGNKHTRATYDMNQRRGTFLVDTRGIDLDQTSESNPWRVTYDGQSSDDDSSTTVMTYAVSNNYPYSIDIKATYLNSTIYKSSEGVYNMTSTFVGRYTDFDSTEGYWSIYGEITIDNYVDMTIEETIDRDYTWQLITTETSGTLSNYLMSYTTSSLTPLVYNPTSNPYIAISGVEMVYFPAADGDIFPSSTVEVESLPNSVKVVRYNGYTYTVE